MDGVRREDAVMQDEIFGPILPVLEYEALDKVIHEVTSRLGSSGIGAYHGKGSFDTFSHRKSVLKQTTLFDLPFRYPNRKNGLNIVKRFLK